MKESFWYLASPYSKYPEGHEAAAFAASREAGLLLNAGILTMSPITHSHPIFKNGHVNGGDFKTWQRLDEALVAASAGVIVCKLDTWDASEGVRSEIDYCRSLGKPVIFMEPGEIPSLPEVVAQ